MSGWQAGMRESFFEKKEAGTLLITTQKILLIWPQIIL